MKPFLYIFLFCLSSASWAHPGYAKRPEPEPVEPVVFEGVEYSAVLTEEKHGFVQARSVETKAVLWEKEIFFTRVFWVFGAEAPQVKAIYISHLNIESGMLIVTNEDGRRYALDLHTKEVSEIVGNCG